MSLKAEAKKKIVADYQSGKNDTGSPEVQIALLTTRINELSEHMGRHKNDLSSRRGLLSMVARRRKLLDYLKKKDEKRYLDVIKRLEIRR